MNRFRRALIASALVFPLGLSLAWAQSQSNAPTPGPAYGRGYGPGMMAGGSGYGPGMMWGNGGPGMMGGYGPGMMAGRGGRGWTGDVSTATNVAEGRLTFLKAELKITAPQEAAWNAYAQIVRTTTKTLSEQHRLYFSHLQQDESLPQRLDEREEVMATAFDAMRKTDAALKPLYAALDDSQKQRADQILGFPMMPFGGMF